APFFPRIDTALLVGEAAPAFAETLAAHGVAHRIVDRLPQAVEQGFELARAHGVGVVLLSPACASFDQYPNFELRGTHFSALARLLEAERAV
ncbi:UDP-N-acetylmuramoyl-L-alanine--D-glutamate ligase, partial [Endobacter medicaginis]|nr:UDP-N-acetylmuramoyl-L-alanine--D-glutamate ligase [Endobacter medicaginis]